MNRVVFISFTKDFPHSFIFISHCHRDNDILAQSRDKYDKYLHHRFMFILKKKRFYGT